MRAVVREWGIRCKAGMPLVGKARCAGQRPTSCARAPYRIPTDILQAKMTAVTALFMIPPAFVFPALLRKANTPPSSVTLSRSRWDEHKAEDEKSTRIRDGRSVGQRARTSKGQSEEASEAEPRRGERNKLISCMRKAAAMVIGFRTRLYKSLVFRFGTNRGFYA